MQACTALYLIMYDLYWMSSCTTLWLVSLDTWRSLANGPHGHSIISIDNVLHWLYKLWYLNNPRECFLCFATGSTSLMEASNSFWTLCTNDLVISKKTCNLNSTVLSVYHNSCNMSFHLVCYLIVCHWCSKKIESTLIDHYITAGTQSHVLKYLMHFVIITKIYLTRQIW